MTPVVAGIVLGCIALQANLISHMQPPAETPLIVCHYSMKCREQEGIRGSLGRDTLRTLAERRRNADPADVHS